MSQRVIAGEDEEADVIYTGTNDNNNDYYYEEEVEEYIEEDDDYINDGDDVVYEVYDDEIEQEHIMREADSILFLPDDNDEEDNNDKKTTKGKNEIKNGQKNNDDKKGLKNDKNDKKKSTQRSGINTKLRHTIAQNLPIYTTSTHPDAPVRPYVVEIGASLRNTRQSGVTATTQARVTKEQLSTILTDLTTLTNDIKGVLDSTSWLDSFVVEAVKVNEVVVCEGKK